MWVRCLEGPKVGIEKCRACILSSEMLISIYSHLGCLRRWSVLRSDAWIRRKGLWTYHVATGLVVFWEWSRISPSIWSWLIRKSCRSSNSWGKGVRQRLDCVCRCLWRVVGQAFHLELSTSSNVLIHDTGGCGVRSRRKGFVDVSPHQVENG